MLFVSGKHKYRLGWKGPFILQGSQGKLFFGSPLANSSGVYLFTVEHRNGYLIYFAGWTTRPFKKRFGEHIRECRNGTYTIFEAESFQNGERVKIWRGMWKGRDTNTPERQKEFQSRRREIEPAIEKLLSTFRVFVAPLKAERRTLARIESAIMNILYSGIEPVSSFPDRGMSLARRWINEKPFVVYSTACGTYLHGLPQCFEA